MDEKEKDLVKRLRLDWSQNTEELCDEAADRIEQLEARLVSNSEHFMRENAQLRRVLGLVGFDESKLQAIAALGTQAEPAGQERGKPQMVAMEVFEKSRKDKE